MIQGSFPAIWQEWKVPQQNFLELIYLEFTLKLTVTMMEMFPLLENSWTLCKLKMHGVSKHPDKGVC